MRLSNFLFCFHRASSLSKKLVLGVLLGIVLFLYLSSSLGGRWKKGSKLLVKRPAPTVTRGGNVYDRRVEKAGVGEQVVGLEELKGAAREGLGGGGHGGGGGGGACGATQCVGASSVGGLAHIYVASSYRQEGRLQPATICVNGKIFTKGQVSSENRGLNFVVYDPHKGRVVTEKHFDTYESRTNSENAARFLKTIPDNGIVIGTTSDEASHRLEYDAIMALRELGASKIGELGYRDSWVFIGQKGMAGTTPHEMHARRQGMGYGPKLEINVCIPAKINGQQHKKEDKAAKVELKKKFCQKYQADYGAFCAVENLDKIPQPVTLDDAQQESQLAYRTPIVVVPGLSVNALRLCLDSLIALPGLDPSLVFVMQDGNYEEIIELAKIYGFKTENLQPSSVYEARLHRALERIFKVMPSRQLAIVVEQQVVVRPDLLNYFGQTLQILQQDNSLFSVSAWNENGFLSTSSDPGLLYRTQDFPTLAWAIKRSIWESQIRGREKQCCHRSTWWGWLEGATRGEILVPDVSRVSWVPGEGLSPEQHFIDAYFTNQERRSSRSVSKLSNLQAAWSQQAYEADLLALIKLAAPLDPQLLRPCLLGQQTAANWTLPLPPRLLGQQTAANQTLPLPPRLLGQQTAVNQTLPTMAPQNYALFYKEGSVGETKLVRALAKCFGLFEMSGTYIRGLHKGMLRFSHQKSQVFVVGADSTYYHLRPARVEPLLASSLG